MDLSRQRGQATTEYVAISAVVAVILIGAATAVAAPSIPRSVAHTIRKGICIVGGDICDPAGAKARGLDPCVVSSADHRRHTGATILFLRVGGTQEYAIERRSDGSYRVSAGDGQDFGASAGAGIRLGGGFHIGPDGTASVGWLSGKAWDLPDAAALSDLLGRVKHRYDLASGFTDVMPPSVIPTPTSRFTRGDASAAGELRLGTLSETMDLRTALGRQTGRDGTVWSFDIEGRSDGPLAELVPALGAGGHLLAEWRRGAHPSLTLRTISASSDHSTETVARLPLTDAGDRAAAARYALAALPTAAGRLAGRDLATRIAARGTVQRFTYAERSSDSGFDVELKLLAGLGAERTQHVTTRELVDAELITRDGTVRREDCLALAPG
ncbi:MAG: hypothetical protein QOE86_2774 [Solirubrobacteraceae bacterium]|jgi:hypothetical protein|nr:hypothetical protein [Solirubrobacteraceae bacterium]